MKNQFIVSFLLLFTIGVLKGQGNVGINIDHPNANLHIGSNILNPNFATVHLIPNVSPPTSGVSRVAFYSDSTSASKNFWLQYSGTSHQLKFTSWDGSVTNFLTMDGNDGKLFTNHFIFDQHRLEIINSGNSTFIGLGAGLNDDLSTNLNVGIGDYALASNTTGIKSVAIGPNALIAIDGGGENTALGVSALRRILTGQENVAVGESAGWRIRSGNRNVFVGRAAARDLNAGIGNTIVGYTDFIPILDYSQDYSVKIGHNAGKSDSSDHVLHIANTNDKTLIKGDFAADSVRINGRLAVSGKVNVGTDTVANKTGDIRFSGGDFEGFDGSIWESFTAAGTGDTDWNEATGVVYNTADNIGVGTSSPAAKMEIKDDTENDGTNATFKITNPFTGSFPSITAGAEMLFDGNEIDVNGLGLLTPMTATLNIQSNSNGNIDLVRGGGGVFIEGPANTNAKLFVTGPDNTINAIEYGAVQIKSNTEPGVMLIDNNEIDVGNGQSIFNDLFLQRNSDGNIYTNLGGGRIGIGTTFIPGTYQMAVKGKIITEEVRVQLHTDWPDYVFEPEYHLISLIELEEKIKKAGHLPGIPSRNEIKEQGHHLGEIQIKLLEKIEELTLYVIQQQKEIDALKQTHKSTQNEN